MEPFKPYTVPARHRRQLQEEEMWMNDNDDWLDNDSSSSDDDDDDENSSKMDDGNQREELYNEKLDEKDAKWMEKLTKHIHSGDRQSDAILNCACCFSLLCADCQQHEYFPNQFRAMFVRNCKANKEKEIRYRKIEAPPQLSKKRQKQIAFQERKRQTKMSRQSNGEKNQKIETQKEEKEIEEEPPLSSFEFIDNILVEDEHKFDLDIYCLVYCTNCETEVGVQDSDEVFHLYNVIPSDF